MNNSQIPPRFVPTLTEVVAPISIAVADLPGNHVALPGSGQSEAQSATQSGLKVGMDVQFEEQMIHRVMQRVDLVLERRLRQAVGQLVMTHTQSLGPRLREEIELLVRESVSQAIAQELQTKR